MTVIIMWIEEMEQNVTSCVTSNFEGNGKKKAVEKRKRPSSKDGNESQKQQHEEGVVSSRENGESL
jgi:hypothetical protein